ncbi:MAG: hypothetical protein J0I93_00140 [Legionella sp.]|nr:hypothetical protein [Legionella sp.]
MQSSFENPPFPKTFKMVKAHLEAGYNWSGGPLTEQVEQGNPLTVLLYDLYLHKGNSKYLHLFQKDVNYKNIKQCSIKALDALRCIIKDALKTTSKQTLYSYQFLVKSFPDRSLLEFFAEIGEEELFKITFKKVATQIGTQDLFVLYKTMRAAYEGSEISQALLLGFSQIKRGSLLYPKMWMWLWGQLQDAQRVEFMNSFEQYMGRKQLTGDFKAACIRLKKNEFAQQAINFYLPPNDLMKALADPDVKDIQAECALYENLYQMYAGNIQGVHVFDEIERYEFSMQSVGLALIGLGIALATLGAGGIAVGMLLHFTWTAGLIGGATLGMGTGLILHGAFARSHEENIFINEVISSAKLN